MLLKFWHLKIIRDLSDELRLTTDSSLKNRDRTQLRASLMSIRDEWHIFEERPCNPSGIRTLLLDGKPQPEVHVRWINSLTDK